MHIRCCYWYIKWYFYEGGWGDRHTGNFCMHHMHACKYICLNCIYRMCRFERSCTTHTFLGLHSCDMYMHTQTRQQKTVS